VALDIDAKNDQCRLPGPSGPVSVRQRGRAGRSVTRLDRAAQSAIGRRAVCRDREGEGRGGVGVLGRSPRAV